MASKKKTKSKTKKPAAAKKKPVKAKAKTSKAKAAKVSAAAAAPASTGEHRERFDRAPYEIPVMDLSEAVALADALLEANLELANSSTLREEVVHLEKARDRAKTAIDTSGLGLGPTSRELSVEARPFDVAMDRAWATFVRRIQDHAELPVDRFSDAVDASKVYAIVQDLSILKLNYIAEFAQIGGRIDSLKREGLLEDARTFAGPAFLEEVLHCHSEYGKAIGVGEAPESSADERELGEARRAIVDAIGEYANQVMVLARAGRPDTWKAVRDALDPITAVRARQARELRATQPRKQVAPHPPVNASVSH